MSDIGLEVVEHVFRLMKIDKEWSARIERGFVWWGLDLAQRVWAEPCFEEDGLVLARLHARTDLVAGFSDDRLGRLAPFLWRAPLNGLVRGRDDPSRLQLACSVYVHSQAQEWLQRVFGLAAAVQAALANELAGPLAAAVGGRVAASAVPRSGPRGEADDMLRVLDAVVAPEGHSGSLFEGTELLETLEALNGTPFVSSGDATALTTEFPFGEETSLLQLDARTADPRLGHGLAVRLSLPAPEIGDDIAAGVRFALELNRRELEDPTGTAFLGSWGLGQFGAAYGAFYPNITARFGAGTALAVAQGASARARWACEKAFGLPWNPQAVAAAILKRYEQVADLTDDEMRRVAQHRAKASPSADGMFPGPSADQTLHLLEAMREVQAADSGSPEGRNKRPRSNRGGRRRRGKSS